MKKIVTLTTKGREKLLKELEEYRKVKRPAVIDRIKRAKEFGDLSENAEYEDARNEQSFIEGRIQELEYLLKNSTISKKDDGVISIGSVVKVKSGGKEFEYEIVGANESDPVNNKISNESPIGKALLGLKQGSKVFASTPSGELGMEVVAIN